MFASQWEADTRFIDGLPTALIKPMSGSGARGMMLDTMKTFGPDSFAGRLACVLQGSSDTTFYVIAVYFGSVGIRNTRYAVSAMLLADLGWNYLINPCSLTCFLGRENVRFGTIKRPLDCRWQLYTVKCHCVQNLIVGAEGHK